MKDSIFSEFQYFIRRVGGYRNGARLQAGETIEDLEQRFRVQIERGLVISEPSAQEMAMEILLSDLSESKQRKHLFELRKFGTTEFEMGASKAKKIQSQPGLTLQKKKERALDWMVKALKSVGVTAQRQPLGVKMLMAEHELNKIDYDDPKDLKLLLVGTVKLSGHAKKANPMDLAESFNKIISRSLH